MDINVIIIIALAVAGVVLACIINRNNPGYRLGMIIVVVLGCVAGLLLYYYISLFGHFKLVLLVAGMAVIVLVVVYIAVVAIRYHAKIRKKANEEKRMLKQRSLEEQEKRQEEADLAFLPTDAWESDVEEEAAAGDPALEEVEFVNDDHIDDHITEEVQAAEEEITILEAPDIAAMEQEEAEPVEEEHPVMEWKEEPGEEATEETLMEEEAEEEEAEEENKPEVETEPAQGTEDTQILTEPENGEPEDTQILAEPENREPEDTPEEAAPAAARPEKDAETPFDRKKADVEELRAFIKVELYDEALKKVFKILNAGYLMTPQEKQQMRLVLMTLKEKMK